MNKQKIDNFWRNLWFVFFILVFLLCLKLININQQTINDYSGCYPTDYHDGYNKGFENGRIYQMIDNNSDWAIWNRDINFSVKYLYNNGEGRSCNDTESCKLVLDGLPAQERRNDNTKTS